MTSKKLCSLLLVAPVLILGACDKTPDSSPSPDSSSISTPDPIEEHVYTFHKKTGHLSVSLGGAADNSWYAMLPSFGFFDITTSSQNSNKTTDPATTYDGNLYIVNYDSDLEAVYTKRDGVFAYSGDNLNFDLRLLPGQVDGSNAAVGTIRDNYESLSHVFNLFDMGLFEMFDLGINTENFPEYYKAGGEKYGALASGFKYTGSNPDNFAIENPELYDNVIGVSLINNTNGYFYDVNSPESEAPTITGYETFNLGGDGGIIQTILGIINLLGPDGLNIDFMNLNIPELIKLIAGIIPDDFHWDIASVPVVGYIFDVLNILGHGLQVDISTYSDEDTGWNYKTLALSLNEEGLGMTGEFVSGILADLLGEGSALQGVGANQLELALNLVDDGKGWEIGGLSLELDIDVTVNTGFLGVITIPEIHLSIDIGFEPGESQLEDNYFDILQERVDYYASAELTPVLPGLNPKPGDPEED